MFRWVFQGNLLSFGWKKANSIFHEIHMIYVCTLLVTEVNWFWTAIPQQQNFHYTKY